LNCGSAGESDSVDGNFFSTGLESFRAFFDPCPFGSIKPLKAMNRGIPAKVVLIGDIAQLWLQLVFTFDGGLKE
jgi:hypothetical protein